MEKRGSMILLLFLFFFEKKLKKKKKERERAERSRRKKMIPSWEAVKERRLKLKTTFLNDNLF